MATTTTLTTTVTTRMTVTMTSAAAFAFNPPEYDASFDELARVCVVECDAVVCHYTVYTYIYIYMVTVRVTVATVLVVPFVLLADSGGRRRGATLNQYY